MRQTTMRITRQLVVALYALTLAWAHWECSPEKHVCDVFLNIEYKLTMMLKRDLVYAYNRTLYRYTDTSREHPLNDTSGIIIADGWGTPKRVIVVNDQMPGPAIIAYRNQKLVVHVTNMLHDADVSIHWHGIEQRGTPWMDGVSMITQCPVTPYQSFTYTFHAPVVGTYWYHSHVASQRTDGFYGPLIIKDPAENETSEFILQVTEWNNDIDSNTAFLKDLSGYYDVRSRLKGSNSLDGNRLGIHVTSTLINGLGQYNDSSVETHTPLTVFDVNEGEKYRFRVIGVGFAYPYRISIDGHTLRVTSTDGYALQPVHVESVVVNPAERVDFEITANQSSDNYWIRAQALVKEYLPEKQAILRYKNAISIEDPVTNRTTCSMGDPCVVFNCPYSEFPNVENGIIECLNFDTVKAKTNDPPPKYEKGKFHEVFLNFGFVKGKAAINAKTFKIPDVSALTQPQELHTSCKNAKCTEDDVCECTHALDFNNNDTVQLVFTNMGTRSRGWSHPIHVHGHTFYVVKMVYGKYNNKTGRVDSDDSDIKCNNEICSNPTWSNQSWINGNVPGSELQRPPRKDSILVPTGGYVVIRLLANNPGAWFLHCHLDIHLMLGMAMILNESFPTVPPPPSGFTECHSFPNDHQTTTKVPEYKETRKEYNVVLGFLIAVSSTAFLLEMARIIVDRRRRNSGGYTRLSPTGNRNHRDDYQI